LSGATAMHNTYVISVTPFTQEGELDEDDLRRHFRRLAATGIGVYVGGGGSGEGHTLDEGENRRILQIAAEELKGRVSVRAMGTEPRSARQMIHFARLVEDARLDAIQVYSLDMGHGNRPTDAELERYFDDVLSAIHIPAVISTHFAVGYLIPLPILTRLVARHQNVIGINCSSDPIYMLQVIDLLGSRVEIHSGANGLGLFAIAAGATGYLSTEGNLAPRLCTSVVEHQNSGDLAMRDDAYVKVVKLYRITYKYGSARGTKAALRILGLPGGFPRPPRLPVPEDGLLDITNAIDELDLRQLEGIA